MNPSMPALAWLGRLTLPAAAVVVLGACSHGTSGPAKQEVSVASKRINAACPGAAS